MNNDKQLYHWITNQDDFIKGGGKEVGKWLTILSTRFTGHLRLAVGEGTLKNLIV